jgi:hypothetical protein
MSSCFTPHERYQDVFSSSEDEQWDAHANLCSDDDVDESILDYSAESVSQGAWGAGGAPEGSPGLFAAAQLFIDTFSASWVDHIHAHFVQKELGITLTEAHGLLAVLEVLEVCTWLQFALLFDY